MKKGNNRNTIQRSLVMTAVQRLPHPTAEEVYDFISPAHPTVSRATVYRNLNVLAEMGEILKISTPGGADHFDMTPGRHYHARCRKCGKVFDINIDIQNIDRLQEQIRDSYGFEVEESELIFKGLCPHCQS